jgi:hypothetical protein
MIIYTIFRHLSDLEPPSIVSYNTIRITETNYICKDRRIKREEAFTSLEKAKEEWRRLTEDLKDKLLKYLQEYERVLSKGSEVHEQ